MDLEKRVNEGGNFEQTAIDLALATASTITAYNIAGHVCSNINLNESPEIVLTAGILTAGGILGYKARSMFNRIVHRKRRNLARIKTIKEMQKDPEFLERQGIKRKELNVAQSALKYLLTTHLGGALGYCSGAAGILPLCIYFGKYYDPNWAENSLGSGPIAGSAIGIYAFAEMAAKKQYKRLTTTASALAGISAAHLYLNPSLASITEPQLWSFLVKCAASGLIAGLVGNNIYREVTRRINQKNK